MRIKFFHSLLAIFLGAFFFGTLAHAWVEPTTVPPGNNILAPLNSSAFGQSKVGGLILNLGNAAHGLIVRYGLVGIGTDNPQAKLDVAGKVRSTGLEVNSTTEGALLPRMTTVQRDAITNKVEGLLIYNTDTKQLEVYSDGAWKASSGGGDGLPKGTIAFFNLSACPSGWTEKTELKGRYPVGLPNSGTLGQSVGTALTNGENRSVGQHNHGVTDPGHDHSGVYAMPGAGSHVPTYELKYANWGKTQISTTNISIQNSGSVAGTNAPYVQLLACEKLTAGSSGSGGSSASSFWQNNGTSIYYNDGNVGVGTSVPTQKIEVAGNVKATGVCIGNDCKNAWPTTTSTDTLQSVTDRGATTTQNISPAGVCLGGECRTGWCPTGYFSVWRDFGSTGFYVCQKKDSELACPNICQKQYDSEGNYTGEYCWTSHPMYSLYTAAKYINGEKYTRAYGWGYWWGSCDSGYVKGTSASCMITYPVSMYVQVKAQWTSPEPGGVKGTMSNAGYRTPSSEIMFYCNASFMP